MHKELFLEVPDLNAIRTFVLVAQAGTLSAAARELKLPTSTVSRSLTRLEKELDVLLVHRSPRGLTLTDMGKDYLHTCRRALRTLKDGGELLEGRRARPSGLLKIACPVTMARNILSTTMKEFLERYPDLRVEIEPYATGWDQEPREDVDVFFKLRAPKDSLRRARAYPGTVRGLFANPEYLSTCGIPATPEALTSHTCIGSGIWTLTSGSKLAAPNIIFKVVASDPGVHLQLAIAGIGIAVLPLYMARQPEALRHLIPVLPRWMPEPISVCALFSGSRRMTPKVQVFLDFLGEYIGTEKDPRLHGLPTRGLFTKPSLAATYGP